MNETEREKLIKNHADWYAENARYHFENGLRHGYGHGIESAMKDMKAKGILNDK